MYVFGSLGYILRIALYFLLISLIEDLYESRDDKSSASFSQ